jgi:hypothetical protein
MLSASARAQLLPHLSPEPTDTILQPVAQRMCCRLITRFIHAMVTSRNCAVKLDCVAQQEGQLVQKDWVFLPLTNFSELAGIHITGALFSVRQYLVVLLEQVIAWFIVDLEQPLQEEITLTRGRASCGGSRVSLLLNCRSYMTCSGP